MKSIFFRKPILLCYVLSFLLLVPNFLPVHLIKVSKKGLNGEMFNPAMVHQIRTVDALLARADSMALARGAQQKTLPYAVILTDLIKDRFYYSYSYYSLQQNWLAAVAGATLWSDLAAIVLPNDILKYPMAACSQQAIVFMECLKRKGINYRKIGFDHHFALEAEIGNQWYYFDPNMEPDFSKVPRASIATLIKNKSLYTIYAKRFDSAEVDYVLGHQFYGKPNESPAPQAFLFHRATKITSKTLFLLPLLFVFVYSKKSRKHASKKAQVNAQLSPA